MNDALPWAPGRRDKASSLGISHNCHVEPHFMNDPQSKVSQAQVQETYTAASSADPTTPVPAVSLTTSQASLAVGGQVALNWSSQKAAACTASGGTGSDGWSGSLSTAGPLSLLLLSLLTVRRVVESKSKRLGNRAMTSSDPLRD